MTIQVYALAKQLEVDGEKIIEAIKQLDIKGKGKLWANLTDEEVALLVARKFPKEFEDIKRRDDERQRAERQREFEEKDKKNREYWENKSNEEGRKQREARLEHNKELWQQYENLRGHSKPTMTTDWVAEIKSLRREKNQINKSVEKMKSELVLLHEKLNRLHAHDDATRKTLKERIENLLIEKEKCEVNIQQIDKDIAHAKTEKVLQDQQKQ